MLLLIVSSLRQDLKRFRCPVADLITQPYIMMPCCGPDHTGIYHDALLRTRSDAPHEMSCCGPEGALWRSGARGVVSETQWPTWRPKDVIQRPSSGADWELHEAPVAGGKGWEG